MKAALVGASDFNAAHFSRQAFDVVVAVDGGFASLSDAGFTPNVVVGDFDSLGFVPEMPDVHRYPAEKDESDMELACRVAAEAGCDTLVLYGCLGRRLDHTLANLQVMLALARKGLRPFAVGDDYAVTLLHGSPEGRAALSFSPIPTQAFACGRYENCVSVFAVGGPAAGVWERGLKYALADATVPDDVSLGLSNEFAEQPVSIEVGRGDLVVTFPLAAWDYLA